MLSVDLVVDSAKTHFPTTANIPFAGSSMIEVTIASSPKTQRAFRIEEELTLSANLVEDGFEWKVGDVVLADASIWPRVGDTVVLGDPHGLLIGYVRLDDNDEMVFCTDQFEPMKFILKKEPTVSEYTFLGTAIELRRKYPN
jgi:hypothetical protein